MDSDKLISGTIRFILASGLTVFLLIKGWVGSYERVEIEGQKVTFYRAHVVEDDPRENFFFKKRLYDPGDVKAFVNRIGGEVYYLSESMALCKEEDASFVAVRLKNDKKK